MNLTLGQPWFNTDTALGTKNELKMKDNFTLNHNCFHQKLLSEHTCKTDFSNGKFFFTFSQISSFIYFFFWSWFKYYIRKSQFLKSDFMNFSISSNSTMWNDLDFNISFQNNTSKITTKMECNICSLRTNRSSYYYKNILRQTDSALLWTQSKD